MRVSPPTDSKVLAHLNTLSPRLWGLDRASVPYEGLGERKTLNVKH